MICYSPIPSPTIPMPPIRELVREVERDAEAELRADLARLVTLIDTALPPAAVEADFAGAEADAAAIVAHLRGFERAQFDVRSIGGRRLYGLRLAGVSASSTSCRVVLLRNWQRAARARIEQFA